MYEKTFEKRSKKAIKVIDVLKRLQYFEHSNKALNFF
jgi:hypothetical protein